MDAWVHDITNTTYFRDTTLDRWSGTAAEYLDSIFDPSVTFDDLIWIKELWSGKLVVKGVQSLDDARGLADLGVRNRAFKPVAASLIALPFLSILYPLSHENSAKT